MGTTPTVKRPPVPASFRKFLDQEPLTAELAAIRDGKLPEESGRQEAKRSAPITDAQRDLLISERQALIELRSGPGWPVLMRLFEKAYDSEEKSAIAVSRQDPLTNRDSIANRWAYLDMLRAAKNMVVGMVDHEVEEYKRKTQETTAAAKPVRKRKS